MAEHIIRLPDVGEGVAEAELVEWHVKIGDFVREDAVLAAVMTDKATVEIPSPVTGEVIWLGAKIGEVVAVGAPLVKLSLHASAASQQELQQPKATAAPAASVAATESDRMIKGAPSERDRPLASPALRQKAKEAGVDLHLVKATGPEGRITDADLAAFLSGGAAQSTRGGDGDFEEIKVIGLRRKIAERTALSARQIPHFTYVEEIDVTALEDCRARLNTTADTKQGKLTLLPFLMRAVVKAVRNQPIINATYDDQAGIIRASKAVHVGIATQTSAGLMVPVVRHCETRDLVDCGREMARVTEAARKGEASREELGGSTITISSLGALGGVAATPIINHPEVAIIGVNKIVTRPVWDGAQFVPRKMMNLSSSFDHRVIDGWDAATFIQAVKKHLEAPETLLSVD